MKKIAYSLSSVIAAFAAIMAVADSAFFINKPQAPKELLKK